MCPIFHRLMEVIDGALPALLLNINARKHLLGVAEVVCAFAITLLVRGADTTSSKLARDFVAFQHYDFATSTHDRNASHMHFSILFALMTHNF